MALSFMQTISFVIYCFLLFIPTCSSLLLTHDEECLALLEFKQSFLRQVGGSQKLDSWMKITNNRSDHGSDCCLWDGVACNHNHHVIELDLSNSALHGSINPNSSLFKLVHLHTLNLSMNDFSGSQIPSQIGRLLQLRHLDLYNSSLSGQIPVEISHLTQLTYLDLSFNSLKLRTSTFEFLLQNMTRLEVLWLSSVDIGSSIPPFLANVSSLEAVHIYDCGLRGRILPFWGNLKNVESLDLSHNQLSGEIPQQLLQLGFLAVFNVSINHLHGPIPRGKQFNTFENSSYIGNPGLCGMPLSKGCRVSITTTLAPLSHEYESFLPRGNTDWIIICLGVGCGLVIGIILGNLLYANCDCLVESTRKRKDRWVRPLRNTRRN